MNEKSVLIRTAMSIGFYPVTDNTKTFIQIPCPSCSNQMMVFQQSRFAKVRIFACTCEYRCRVSEGSFEELTGRCFVCGKRDCCGSDHSFHGELIGMGF